MPRRILAPLIDNNYMARIVEPKDRKSYQVYYYNLNNERRRLSVGTNRENAEIIVNQINEWLKNKIDPEEMVIKLYG